MIGALSDPESCAILDEVVADIYRMRALDQPRDFGLGTIPPCSLTTH